MFTMNSLVFFFDAFLLRIYIRVELLSHRYARCSALALWNAAKYHCEVAVPFYTPSSSQRVSVAPNTKRWQRLPFFFLKPFLWVWNITSLCF